MRHPLKTAAALAAALIFSCNAFLHTAAFAQTAPSPEVLKDLAPTGKLRAAINYGNSVLAQKAPGGAPRGMSVDLAAAVAKRLGVPVDYVYSDFTLACGNVYLKRHADGRLNGEVRPEGRGADHVGSCRRPAALLLWLNAALV